MTQFPIPHPSEPGQEVMLERKEAHHLRDVLRMRVGEPVVLFHSEGDRYSGRIASLSPQEVRVKIESRLPAAMEHGEITLAQALLKGEKMEFVIQKGVELGVHELIPFVAARSIVREAKNKLPRWRRIVDEAAKQCGRTSEMKLREPIPFKDLVSSASGSSKVLFWEGEKEPLKLEGERILAVVGPEGGFAPEEVEIALKNNFRTAGLGSRILRAETAALVAMTLIQHELGNI